MNRSKSRKRSWVGRHSLSIVAVTLLMLWLAGYLWLDPKSHLAAFCGNAVADWSGSLLIIVGTTFLYEQGSRDSKPVRGRKRNYWLELMHQHSLLLVIIVTGIGWAILFSRMTPTSKWGQVVGNLVSEWVQIAGLVFLTKWLVQIGSKE